MSVQNPGVSRNAPPKITSTPSSDLARGHAALGERVVEAPPRRAALRAHQQRAEDRVGDQQRDRPQRADRLADLDDHVDLDDRDDDEEGEQEQEGHRPQGYAVAAARRATAGRAAAGAAIQDHAGSRCSPTSSMSRWICGWAPRMRMRRRPGAGAARPSRGRPSATGRRRPARAGRRADRVAACRARGQRRRRRLCVARSSSPAAAEHRRVFAEGDDGGANLHERRGLHSSAMPIPRGCRSRSHQRDRPRARVWTSSSWA